MFKYASFTLKIFNVFSFQYSFIFRTRGFSSNSVLSPNNNSNSVTDGSDVELENEATLPKRTQAKMAQAKGMTNNLLLHVNARKPSFILREETDVL